MGAGVRLAGQHIGFGGLKKHVVKGEDEEDIHVKATFCCAPGQWGDSRSLGDSWRPMYTLRRKTARHPKAFYCRASAGLHAMRNRAEREGRSQEQRVGKGCARK